MKFFKTLGKNLLEDWDQFWFTPVALKPIAFFRMCFGSVAFVFYIDRMQDVRLLFSDSGILTLERSKHLWENSFQTPLFFFPENLVLIYMMHGLLLMGLLMIAIGRATRWMTVLTFFLHILFLQRNYLAYYGADKVISFGLFSLCLMRANDYYSLRKKGSQPIQQIQNSLQNDFWTPIGRRLLQLQVCFIYVFSGIEKVRGASWADGTALWKLITFEVEVKPWMVTLAYFEPFLITASFLILAWEIYFPLGVVIPKIRVPWLLLGAFFHLGIAVTLGLPFFSLLMISFYFLFLSESEFKSLRPS